MVAGLYEYNIQYPFQIFWSYITAEQLRMVWSSEWLKAVKFDRLKRLEGLGGGIHSTECLSSLIQQSCLKVLYCHAGVSEGLLNLSQIGLISH